MKASQFQSTCRYPFGSMSVAQFQDRQRIGWSRARKRLFYLALFGISVDLFANYYNTDITYSFKMTPLNQKIILNCPSLRQGTFKPTFYLQSGFLQSLYGSKFDPTPYVPLERAEIPVGKGLITLDTLPIHHKYLRSDGTVPENLRTVVILHGLTGASESNYIRHIALHASRHGFRTVVLNMRGYSHSRMTSAEPTDFGKLDDLEAGFKFIKELYPKAPLYAIGFSMGANQLARYILKLARFVAKHPGEIKAGVCISTAWRITELAREVSAPTKRIYDLAITLNFIRNLKWNLDVFKSAGFDVDSAIKCTRTRDFDEVITRPALKYGSVEEMYGAIDCTKGLDLIKTPILFIGSMDDPIIRADMLPKEELSKNPNLILAMTQRGGHIEWFTGFRASRWIRKPVVEYLDCIDKMDIITETS